jgi:hypothetical protein
VSFIDNFSKFTWIYLLQKSEVFQKFHDFQAHVERLFDGIVLTQEKYTRDILRRVGMQDCKAMHTPLPADENCLSLMVIC